MDKRASAPPLEKSVTAAIVRHLKGVPGLWFFKVAGGGFQRAGVPDIVGVWQGRFFALEIKRPGVGRLTALQRAAIESIRAAGGVAEVVTSAAEARAALEKIKAGGGAK